eukprot:767646-Hanusia_phi.AAC.7
MQNDLSVSFPLGLVVGAAIGNISANPANPADPNLLWHIERLVSLVLDFSPSPSACPPLPSMSLKSRQRLWRMLSRFNAAARWFAPTLEIWLRLRSREVNPPTAKVSDKSRIAMSLRPLEERSSERKDVLRCRPGAKDRIPCRCILADQVKIHLECYPQCNTVGIQFQTCKGCVHC